MKLYAQHGAQAGNKVWEGLERGIVDGVIFSPRDIGADNLRRDLRRISQDYPQAEGLFDPQYYTCTLAGSGQVRLGYLQDEYSAYFAGRRAIDLRKEKTVQQDVEKVLRFQDDLPVSKLIAPNILISQSFDSREAAVSMDFLRVAKESARRIGSKKPVLATIAVSREALINRRELEEFANEVTVLEEPPDGYYLLIASRSPELRLDVYNADVLGAWMYLNYVFRLNGLEAVNGYSDLVGPLLCCAGGSAGATGWWSNLRSFSLERFEPAVRGGRQPIPRYLSLMLLNRITFRELDQLKTLVPSVLNGLPTDQLYAGEGSEPDRSREVLQSWDALRRLGGLLEGPRLEERLKSAIKLITEARRCYDESKGAINFEPKSNDEHLDALEEGIALFKKLAELESSS